MSGAGSGRYALVLKLVEDPGAPNSLGGSLLDEIVRDGARQMLAAALLAEVAGYVEAHHDEWTIRAVGWWSATATTSRGR